MLSTENLCYTSPQLYPGYNINPVARHTHTHKLRSGTLRSAMFTGTLIWSGVTWFQWQSVKVSQNRLPRASGGHTPGSNPTWRGRFYPQALKVTGLGAFFELPGVCGLRPCARAHLKWPFAILVMPVGRTTSTTHTHTHTHSNNLPYKFNTHSLTHTHTHRVILIST